MDRLVQVSSYVPEDSLYFFFQAEDGIRDYKVTGVQTCALPMSLACTTTPRACTWDTSACAAPACAEYGVSLTRLENLAAPGTDDTLRFSARNFPGAAFDPLTEDVSFVLRDEGGAILTAAIPGGSPGWTATATS